MMQSIHVTLDVTQEYYEKSIKYMVFGNVLRNGTYPISVSSERIFQAIAIINYAKEIKADYVAHAAVEAGVEMGIYPKDAQKMVAQSVKGAAELLLQNDTHPAIEIDKVTTPGGLTIKGLNELEHVN